MGRPRPLRDGESITVTKEMLVMAWNACVRVPVEHKEAGISVQFEAFTQSLRNLVVPDEQAQWARPDTSGNTHVLPTAGRKHETAQTCWCHPELIGDYTADGGAKVYLHREIQ